MPEDASYQPVPMLDLSRQFDALREELMEAIERVCVSQRFVQGPEVAGFERAAGEACGAAHAVGCASGTDALWLALAGARIGPGDAVITTPFSFFASVSAILRAGARPVFVDIDPLTFNLCPNATRATLTPDVKAVLPVHLYGQCADWDGFEALQADRSGLLLFEDAAQAFGAVWGGRPAGSLGVAAAFSFYPTKNLAAIGDAGLVTTSSSELAEHMRSLGSHGMKQRYFHEEVGWNSRLDALQAAVLAVKLKYLPRWNQRRRELAANYNELFRAAGLVSMTTIADGVVLPYVHPQAQHVFHQYVVRVLRRDELRAYLAERGIGSEVYYPLPLHLQEALLFLGYTPGDFPEAERAAAEVLALPMFPELREDEQETVVEAIAAFFA